MNPDLPFFLIGDSGQEDPEIYSSIIEKYPGKIKAVYIRNVSKDLKRSNEIHELAKKAVNEGSSLVLADNTLVMAEHAAEKGWIRRESLPDIGREKEEDEGPPSVMEKILGREDTPEAPTTKIEGRR